ncbi:MAG: methyltransferase domain-containing protein [Candidatus Promineofilum sp.]|nr:methyltransferase domain-containing protein [Promineifilum sp.]
MDELTDTQRRFAERYEEGRVPWDDPTPPPEIVALADALPPGRALDVGCGYGRAVIYLAGRGWSAVGVDFVPQAIAEAQRRAAAAGVSERATFHAASATDLAFLAPPFDLVIDVGCMHSFTEEMLAAYRDEIVRLLPPGGQYVLFAHLRQASDPEREDGPRGIAEATIYELLREAFRLERVERGVTQVEDRPPWNSAWFWFRRE